MSNGPYIKLTKKQLSLKPGDLVTAYAKGIHRIISIGEKGVGCDTYLVTYESVLNRSLRPSVKKKNHCDLSYCEKVDQKYLEGIKDSHVSQIKNLTEAIENAYRDINV